MSDNIRTFKKRCGELSGDKWCTSAMPFLRKGDIVRVEDEFEDKILKVIKDPIQKPDGDWTTDFEIQELKDKKKETTPIFKVNGVDRNLIRVSDIIHGTGDERVYITTDDNSIIMFDNDGFNMFVDIVNNIRNGLKEVKEDEQKSDS